MNRYRYQRETRLTHCVEKQGQSTPSLNWIVCQANALFPGLSDWRLSLQRLGRVTEVSLAFLSYFAALPFLPGQARCRPQRHQHQWCHRNSGDNDEGLQGIDRCAVADAGADSQQHERETADHQRPEQPQPPCWCALTTDDHGGGITHGVSAGRHEQDDQGQADGNQQPGQWQLTEDRQ